MWLVVWLVVVLVQGEMAAKEAVNLAVFLPISGSWSVGKTIAPAAQLAADYINNNDAILPGYAINISYYDTGCNQGKTIWKLIQQVKTKKMMAGIIGGACDPVCEVLGLFAAHRFMPMISWGCQSEEFSDKTKFLTFARTIGSRKGQEKPLLALLEHFNWNRFSIYSSIDQSYEWLSRVILEHSEQNDNILVKDMVASIPSQGHNVGEELEHLTHTLEHLLETAKVLLFCAGPVEIRHRMLKLLDLDKLTGEYVIITYDLTTESVLGDDGRDEEAKKAFQGLLNINLKKPEDESYRAFEHRIRSANERPPFNYVMAKDTQVHPHAGMLYDAVLLYSYALQDAIAYGRSITDVHFISDLLFNREFRGIAGDVYIDKDGNRETKYIIQIFSGDKFINIGEYSHKDDIITIRPDVNIVFAGGKTDVPLDRPVCGWKNELCSAASVDTLTIGLVCGVIVALAAASVGGVFLYRKLKFESDIKNEVFWRIKPEALSSAEDTDSSTSLNRFRQNESVVKKLLYKGMAVHLTRISEGSLFVDKQLIISCKMVRELHHENINTFFGLSVDEPYKGILTSYASRGSLADVLANTDVNINADFKLSFMMDICKGMECLHGSSLAYHGRLKSANCLIDNRWICKITDFGLCRIRIHDRSGDEYRKYSALLYKAPEILRQTDHSGGGSKLGDVYSFGIIMQEIITLVRPYQAITNEEPKEIVRLVQLGLDPPYRPMVPKDICPHYMCKLMISCWEEEGSRRPSFTDVIKTFKEANEGKAFSILDKTCQMMEQYTNHLEELVAERSNQLAEEKEKTEKLLYQMLPKFIADPLKLGERIQPQAYERATVYFSDVVSFTNIASDSTPLEVVNFLNDLYSAFDCIVEKYDVYKIETIGDAYVTVSGVPDHNGNQHAAAVASLSLEILSFISRFTIKHMPRRQLKLRIGIHSGPVAAGVVGIKMPRYCLFGETVNIASMLESKGEALKIHISKTTRDILVEIGGYIMEKRGEINLQDIGNMTTYWLLYQTDFDKAQPTLSTHVHNTVQDLMLTSDL